LTGIMAALIGLGTILAALTLVWMVSVKRRDLVAWSTRRGKARKQYESTLISTAFELQDVLNSSS